MKPTMGTHLHRAAQQPAPQPRRRRALAARPVSPEQRDLMIAEAAYYFAERRGFAPGSELDDWLAAESEIERLLENLDAEESEEEET
jgi:hypothetical protein